MRPAGRVVDDDDVTGPDLGADRRDVRRGRPFIDDTLGRAEVSAVSRGPVETVVDALRDGEELWFPCDDEPLGVDADTPHVAEEGGQHLGHTAPRCGRVDVHDLPVAEGGAHFGGSSY